METGHEDRVTTKNVTNRDEMWKQNSFLDHIQQGLQMNWGSSEIIWQNYLDCPHDKIT